MAAALTPKQALARLGELSADVVAGVVLDHRGRRLAGPPELGASARRLVDLATREVGGPRELRGVEVLSERGAVYAGRSRRYILAVVAVRSALPALMLYDIERTLVELEAAHA